jgi:hypothetical protein
MNATQTIAVIARPKRSGPSAAIEHAYWELVEEQRSDDEGPISLPARQHGFSS